MHAEMDPTSSNEKGVGSKVGDDASATENKRMMMMSYTYMDEAMYKAAEEGRFEAFKHYSEFELLESLRTPNRNTVLHVHLETPTHLLNNFNNNFVEEILKMCPSLLRQLNAKGQTPLHVAAMHGRSDAIKHLITRISNDGRDIEKDEAVITIIREMLRKEDEDSNNALHLAAAGQYGNRETIKALLEFEDSQYPYPPNKSHETPLYIAARKGSHSLVAEMLDKYADHCKTTLLTSLGIGPHATTALHAAVISGNQETTRIILEKEGDNHKLTVQTDEKGHTPLHYAAHLGNFPAVKMLLKHDKSAAYVGDKERGMTPLLMAARQGHGVIVREIVLRCPDCCEIVDKKFGWNLLHFAAIRQSPVELFIFATYQRWRLVRNFPIFREPPAPAGKTKGIMPRSSGGGGGGKELCASIRNLRDEKDKNGNTPLQLHVVAKQYFCVHSRLPYYFMFPTREAASYTRKLTPNRKVSSFATHICMHMQ